MSSVFEWMIPFSGFLIGGVCAGVIMALKMTVLQVAQAIDAVAEAIRKVHVRLSIADMLELCDQASASSTGRRRTV